MAILPYKNQMASSQEMVRYSVMPDGIQLTALEKDIPHTHYIPFFSLSRYSMSGPDKQGVGKIYLFLKTESQPLVFAAPLLTSQAIFRQLGDSWTSWMKHTSQN